MRWLDSIAEGSMRAVAKRTSRRGFLGSLGALLVGSSALPLLPVARGAQGQGGAKPGAASNPSAATNPGAKPDNSQDPTSCEYWRHCAIDGYLCGCCGGSQSACPPGTQQSAVTWVGTCHNPADGRDYVVSYNDCCGKSTCGRCLCNRNERDTPIYAPFQSNDYNWCSGNSKANIPYHCSTARIVAVAK
jgi:methylamine dehydrogenase light chain